MNSKNKRAMSAAERRHVDRVKALPCSVCDVSVPSEAHEIKQGLWFTAIAICPSCHRDSVLGIHGQKMMWRIKKMDELSALNITYMRLLA